MKSTTTLEGTEATLTLEKVQSTTTLEGTWFTMTLQETKSTTALKWDKTYNDPRWEKPTRSHKISNDVFFGFPVIYELWMSWSLFNLIICD